MNIYSPLNRMSMFRARLIIIVVVLLLLYIFRKFIRRLIFIIILLAVAFFIYGLFSPSGAAKLRYNVKTFPQRIVSWFGGEAFLSYPEYQLQLPTIDSLEVEENVDESAVDIPSDSVDAPSSPLSSPVSTKQFSSLSSVRAQNQTFLNDVSAQIREKVQNPVPVEENVEIPLAVIVEEVSVTEPTVVEESTIIVEEVKKDKKTDSQSISTTQTTKKTTTTNTSSPSPAAILSQQDIRDAEELFGILLHNVY